MLASDYTVTGATYIVFAMSTRHVIGEDPRIDDEQHCQQGEEEADTDIERDRQTDIAYVLVKTNACLSTCIIYAVNLGISSF